MQTLRRSLLISTAAVLVAFSTHARDEDSTHRPAVREAVKTDTRAVAEEGGMSKGLGAGDKFKKDLNDAKEQKRKGEIAEGTDDALKASKGFKGNAEGQGAKGGDASVAMDHQKNMAELKKQCTATCKDEVDNPKTPYDSEPAAEDKTGLGGIGKAVGNALKPYGNDACAGSSPPIYFPPGCNAEKYEAYKKKLDAIKAERKAKIDACVKDCMKVKTSGFDGVSMGGGDKH